MENNVEKIKERLNIVDVVSSYIRLQNAGTNFRANCPFHNERTPSFFVSPTRNTYHCFGCNRGGDIFTFVEEMEGVDFKGALGMLADQAGVTLSTFDPKNASEKDRLLTLIETATLFYQRNLTQEKQPLAYLYKRGLKPGTLKDFRLGFAKDEWRSLRDYLLDKSFTDAEMEKAGLVIKSEKGFYDRFRSRVMFPIFDNAGRPIGFSGRIFGKEDDKTGKYINSPETALFNKSRVLYGFEKAKQAIRKENTAILVEGQMDVLLAHQEGMAYTVAASGTAFSETHAKTLSRLAEKAVLAFDADEAGMAATQRSAATLLAHGIDVRVVDLAEGTDPADVIAQDKQTWEKQVAEAQHAVHFFLHKLKEKHGQDDRLFKRNASKLILPLVKSIRNRIDREHFISEVAHTLRVPDEAVREELAQTANIYTPTESSTDQAGQKEDVKPEPKTRKDILEEHVVSIVLWQETTDEPVIDLDKTKKMLHEAVGEEHASELLSVDDVEKQERIFEVELYFSGSKHIQEEIDEMLQLIKKEYIRDQYKEATEALREAEECNDTQRVAAMLQRCQELSHKLHETL